MEQRPLRLGDIVDDYCPRERRVTNHAIVALVDETVKQTRCTTCDHEHVFKNAREPRRRKKEDASALYSQVLSGLQKTTPGLETDPHMPNDIDDETEIGAEEEAAHAATLGAIAAAASADAATPAIAAPEPAPATNGNGVDDDAEADEVNGNVASDDEPWSMHRRLIRAQLPRTGNEPPPARPLPDFTIRQPGSRAGQRPWGRGGGGGEANGNTPNANRHGRGGQAQDGGQGRPAGRGGRFSGPPRPEGGRRGGPGQGGGGGRPGGGGGRGRRSR